MDRGAIEQAAAAGGTRHAAARRARGPGVCELSHGVGALVRALAAERMPCRWSPAASMPIADAAVQAIRDGAREFLPLPPDPELIAAILEAVGRERTADRARSVMQATAPRRAGGGARMPRC